MKEIKNLGPLRVFSHAGWRAISTSLRCLFSDLGKNPYIDVNAAQAQAAGIAEASHAEPVVVDS